MSEEISVFTDGGSRGNPGNAAYGFVIKKDSGIIYSLGKCIGIATNNVAEYSAIFEALSWIYNNRESLGDISGIKFFMDSLLACQQLKGVFKVKNMHLAEFIRKIRELEAKISLPILYFHIPREKNKEADKLVNQALDNSY